MYRMPLEKGKELEAIQRFLETRTLSDASKEASVRGGLRFHLFHELFVLLACLIVDMFYHFL